MVSLSLFLFCLLEYLCSFAVSSQSWKQVIPSSRHMANNGRKIKSSRGFPLKGNQDNIGGIGSGKTINKCSFTTFISIVSFNASFLEFFFMWFSYCNLFFSFCLPYLCLSYTVRFHMFIYLSPLEMKPHHWAHLEVICPNDPLIHLPFKKKVTFLMTTGDLFSLDICGMLALVVPLILHLQVQRSPSRCHSCRGLGVPAHLPTFCRGDHGTHGGCPFIFNPLYYLTSPFSCFFPPG